MSLSVLALFAAEGPIVVTFHTSTERSRALNAFGGVLRLLMEKVTARIAVSPPARRVQVEHLGGDAVEIPNGVDVARFARGPLLPGYPRPATVGFLGRFDEPRKGMPVLLDALRAARPDRPDAAAAGGRPGRRGGAAPAAGPVADRLDVLGPVDEATKAAALRSVDVFCAPNLGGESFGMVLTEAMAAGAPVLASDLDAFRAVLDGGRRAVPDRRRRRAGRRAGDAAGRPGAAGRRWPPPARAAPPPTTGRWSPPRCCGSTGPRWPPTRGWLAWAPADAPCCERRSAAAVARPRYRGRCGHLGVGAADIAVLVLCWVLLCWTGLQRLHRLHRRTDAARSGLAAALRQRAVGGRRGRRRAARAGRRGAAGRAGRAPAAGPPRASDGSDREAAENALGRAGHGRPVAALPDPLRAELNEAEQLLVVARSVLNDAVRDTLALRSRRLVRWFRLAGTAPLPAYFEIADAAADVRRPRPKRSAGQPCAGRADVRSPGKSADPREVHRVVARECRPPAPTAPAAGHRARQARHGRDAQGRRDHGRGHPRAGEDRRGRRGGRGDGPGAGAGRHPGRTAGWPG